MVKKEEPKKEEVKRTKVKVPKAKKYEDLPEIPDYERPELEVYEESDFDPTKFERKPSATPSLEAEKGVASKPEIAEPAKNGLAKVCFLLFLTLCINVEAHLPKS